MRGLATLLMLQSSVYGPTLPVESEPTRPTRPPTCEQPAASDEIVVCAHQDVARDQRLKGTGQLAGETLNPGDNFRLKVGPAQIHGGGPPGQNGQSVGVGIRVPLKLP